jgi:hypothetical protein
MDCNRLIRERAGTEVKQLPPGAFFFPETGEQGK